MAADKLGRHDSFHQCMKGYHVEKEVELFFQGQKDQGSTKSNREIDTGLI